VTYIVLISLVLAAMGYAMVVARRTEKLKAHLIELKNQLRVQKAATLALQKVIESEAKLAQLNKRIEKAVEQGDEQKLNDILDDILNHRI